MFHSRRSKGSCCAFTGTVPDVPTMPCPLFASLAYCRSPSAALPPHVGPGSFVPEPGTTPTPSLKPSGHAVPQPGQEDMVVSQLSPVTGRTARAEVCSPTCPICTHSRPSAALPWDGGLRGAAGITGAQHWRLLLPARSCPPGLTPSMKVPIN